MSNRKLWLPGEPLGPLYSIRNFGEPWVRNVPLAFANNGNGGGQGGGGGGQALAAPTNLVATPASSSQIDLTWTDNAKNDGGYSVEHSLNGTTWTVAGTTAANATSYSDTGLTASTLYYYRVRAFKGGRFGPYSAVQSATTDGGIPAPIDFWRLADVNDSADSRTLTNNNSVTFQPAHIGDGAHQTANNQGLSRASDSFLQWGSGGDRSLFIWVYRNSLNFQTIASKGNHSANKEWWLYWDDSDSRMEVQWSTDGASYISTGQPTKTLAYQTWSLVELYYENSTKTLGLRVNNGTAATVVLAAHPFQGTGPFALGCRFNGASPIADGLVGDYDAVALFDRLLTSDERIALYNGGAGLEYYSGAWQ